MPNRTFARARTAPRTSYSDGRRFTLHDRRDLRALASGTYVAMKDRLPEDHPCLEGIDTRLCQGQERHVERRCWLLLAASSNANHRRAALRLARCTPTSPCRMAVCWLCKHQFAEGRVQRAWEAFRKIDPSEIVWVTVLARLVYGGPAEVVQAVTKTKATMRYLMDREAKRDPKFEGIAWLGSFEVDLYRPGSIDADSRKGRTLRKMIGYDGEAHTAVQVVHFHLVLSLNGVPKHEFQQILKKHFPGTRRVRVTKLRANRTPQENVERLARYASKCHPCYQEAVGASERNSSKYNESGRYESVFDDLDLIRHVRLQSALGDLGGKSKFDRGL